MYRDLFRISYSYNLGMILIDVSCARYGVRSPGILFIFHRFVFPVFFVFPLFLSVSPFLFLLFVFRRTKSANNLELEKAETTVLEPCLLTIRYSRVS